MDEAVEQLIPAVEEQLTSPATPYVRETLDRLLTEPDIEGDEAKAMIAFCLADEIESLGAEKRDFSEDRYKTLLALLPIMPEGR
ncbi:hypothetical protein N9H09_00495 [bacterium]|nr:hypothetical protein [bacterium]MDB4735226.1 hypothetical protein [Akkermansiaceae bacterium]